KRAVSAPAGPIEVQASLSAAKTALLSRAYGVARDMLNHVIYPDVRSEWYFFARKKLRLLLATNKYDFIVSSHEPFVDIFLGFFIRKKGIPWIVDLGDPLLTPYSPYWRRAIDLRVE